jgi:hypothetical protein
VSFIVWIHSLALLVLNLSLLAWVKLRWPQSSVGSVVNVIV